MKRLIINADDLGADVARNEGIFEAIRAGVVTSATILPNGPALEHALGKIRSGGFEQVSFGVHLNLTEGRPLAEGLSCLTGPDGNFLGKAAAHRLLMNTVDDPPSSPKSRGRSPFRSRGFSMPGSQSRTSTVTSTSTSFRRRCRTVAETARGHGIRRMRIPDETVPSADETVPADLLEEARRFGALGREARKVLAGTGIVSSDHFRGLALKGRLDTEGLLKLLETLPGGITELMVHPGRVPAEAALFSLLLAGPRAGAGSPPGSPFPACPRQGRGGIGFLQGDFFMKPFRLLILTPSALPTVTGNAMTAERWRRSLVGMGLDVRVLDTEGLDAGGLKREIDRFKPDLLHIHNAYRAGGLLLHRALADCRGRLPFVVSPSGTDMNIESKVDSGKERVSSVLSRAEAIIVQSEEGRERLQEIVPGRMDRVHFVPKSFVWLGEETLDLRASCGFSPGDVVFFMPAGIRPVKGNLECLLGFERIHELRSAAKVIFAGPPLDEAYAERFFREAERLRDFARWVPPIHPAAMRAAYGSVDVILNGSASEGLSNVLIEGRAAGKPLLASDIPGNRWPVLGDPGDSPMGILFDPSDPDDFVRKGYSAC